MTKADEARNRMILGTMHFIKTSGKADRAAVADLTYSEIPCIRRAAHAKLNLFYKTEEACRKMGKPHPVSREVAAGRTGTRSGTRMRQC